MSQSENREVLTPSALNRASKRLLQDGFPSIWVQGEVSNLARPASGHLYFSLKDDDAQIRCALFRQHARTCAVQPENGMQALIHGRVSLYEPRGDYQLIADRLEDAGEGALQKRFEALKRQLQEEGLFDTSVKLPLPPFPKRIAVVTSPSGAAIRDILQVLGRRWPVADIRLYAVPVQGDEAAPAIVKAIAGCNAHEWADIVIVGRGGGSLEDLWAFNEEAVARVIHASRIPVISAVGHEVDFTIADFVADLRAPTPSAAAELVTPDINQLAAGFETFKSRLSLQATGIQQRLAQTVDQLAGRLSRQHPVTRIELQRTGLRGLQRRLLQAGAAQQQNRRLVLNAVMTRLQAMHPHQQILQRRQALADAHKALLAGWRGKHLALSHALSRQAATLNAVSPLSTLARGYTILQDDDGRVVKQRSQVSVGQHLQAQLSDGRLECAVSGISARRLGDEKPGG